MRISDAKANSIRFSGDISSVKNCLERSTRAVAIEKGIKDVMPKSIKTISKMSKFTGEMPNIIINALGTGLVAPIFIKYNFLSKTDEDTRTYSALRQPLSAVLSVVTSLAVVVPFNKLIDGMSKNGFFYSIKDKAASSRFNKPTEKLEDLVQHATKTGKIEYTAGNKKITLSKESVNHVMEQTIDNNLKDVNDNLGRHETEKIGKQIARGEYYRHNKADVKTVLEELDSKVSACSDNKEISKFFKSKLKALKANKADQEIIDIVEDISLRPNSETIKSKITEIDTACNKFSKLKSLEDVSKAVAKKIEVDNNALRAEKATLEKMKTAIKNGESFEHVTRLSKNLQGGTFVYDVLEKHMGNIGANLKGVKQIAGLVVSLAILPVACSMLNYIYPIFMDKFFPGLSNKKHAAHKDKDSFEKSAPQANSATTSVKKEQEVSK